MLGAFGFMSEVIKVFNYPQIEVYSVVWCQWVSGGQLMESTDRSSYYSFEAEWIWVNGRAVFLLMAPSSTTAALS